jgi:transcriptional regulator with XRE-family HTH domain
MRQDGHEHDHFDDPRDFEGAVRANLRARRTERGLSLEALGRKAGMSASLLSRLESGTRRLSIDHLAALARALEVSVDTLLDVSTEDPRIHPIPRKVAGSTYWPLSNGSTPGTPTAYKVRIPVSRKKPVPQVHPGRDWLYVLSGRLLLHVNGHEHLLEAGEAAEFATTDPHFLAAVGGPVELLTLFGPAGEGVHLHGT